MCFFVLFVFCLFVCCCFFGGAGRSFFFFFFFSISFLFCDTKMCTEICLGDVPLFTNNTQ